MPLKTRKSEVLAVTATSATFGSEMGPGIQYRFVSDVNCWVRIGEVTDVAQPGIANNHLYVAGQSLWLGRNPGEDGFVHVISDGTDGQSSLSIYEV